MTTRKTVTIRRFDPKKADWVTRTFEAEERDPHTLSPKRQAELNALFAWCDRKDREYAEREARGDFRVRRVPFYR